MYSFVDHQITEMNDLTLTSVGTRSCQLMVKAKNTYSSNSIYRKQNECMGRRVIYQNPHTDGGWSSGDQNDHETRDRNKEKFDLTVQSY